MTIRAYFLLSDPDETDENQDLAADAAALEELTGLEAIDFIYLDDEIHFDSTNNLSPYIAYQ